jgi:hypothetical protein
VGRKGDSEYLVTISDLRGTELSYHFVCWSPTGYSWGYAGAGPTDLAASLLADRLGYLPGPPITHRFRDDVGRWLDRCDFVLTFADVDEWAAAHGALFSKYPQSVPFDPYAAGGAD